VRIDDLARDAGRRARHIGDGHELEALDRFHRARERRRRTQSIAAGALAIGVTAVIAVTSLVLSRSDVAPATVPPSGTILLGEWNERIQQAEWFTVRTDGTQLRSIGVTATCAEWMPDGRHLFITDDEAVSPRQPLRPAVVDVTGEDRRALDATEDPELHLGCGAVSPDGTRIALEGFGREGSAVGGIYTVDASDGGDAIRITIGPDSYPAYSPDGREIVFLRTKAGVQPAGAGALFVVASEGGHARRITPWGASFLRQSWSPDGEWIAFEHPYGELYLVHPDGTGFHRVPVDLPSGTGAANPSWSPDGRWLVFSLRRDGVGEIWAVRPDGTGLQRIVAEPGTDLSMPRWSP
jgi:Tol biopolymer transport system component